MTQWPKPTAPPTGLVMTNKFAAVSRKVSDLAGRPATFIAACALILVWGACGPLFGYSDTWQLIINTGTTIVTFLMVFLIQSSQNTDTKALHLKLDELIRTSEQASNVLIDIEHGSDEQLAAARETACNTKIAECP